MLQFVIFQYPAYYLLLCLLLGVGYAWLFYYRNTFSRNGSVWQFPASFMFFFRAVSVFLIAALLLAPLFRSINRTVDEPVIVFLNDNSRSVVLNRDSAFIKNELPAILTDLYSKLDQDYNVRSYRFSDEAEQLADMTFDGRNTNINEAFSQINRRYYGRNLGAVVLTTDGIYNQGSNPLFSADDLNVPIYTIAIGDTLPPRDLRITDVLHNRVVYAGNEFQVRVRINADHCSGEEAVLTVQHDGQTLKEQSFIIDEEAYYTDIDLFLKAEEAGLKRFEFTVTKLEDEINYRNNSWQAIVEVMESKQKILLLSAAPHPDVGALRRSVERHERFEVTALSRKDYELNPSGFYEKLEDHNLLILHGIPQIAHND